MKSAEGKSGRVFILRFDDNENVISAVEKFAVDTGISTAYVAAAGDHAVAGLLVPDASGSPKLQMSATTASLREAVIQEIIGVRWAIETARPVAVAVPETAPLAEILHTGDHTHLLTTFNATLV